MYWNVLFRSDLSVPWWLIETWDVLKFVSLFFYPLCRQRLIETWDVLKWMHGKRQSRIKLINRNMRCIEICIRQLSPCITVWLIETWDVLKSLSSSCCKAVLFWLIETWDVLKYIFEKRIKEVIAINRNMRCIEIYSKRVSP